MTAYRERAQLLRVLAHPMRLQILEIIRASDQCVCHLSAALKKPQPYVSQQLAVLRNAGLIADHKEGNNVYYGLADGSAGEQAAAVVEAMSGDVQAVHAEAHRMVPGCYCPKCDPNGTCRPRHDGFQE